MDLFNMRKMQITIIMYIEDQFYTVSNKYIMVSPISDVEDITNSITLRNFQTQTNPYGEPVVIPLED